ncbi:hypothetical protein KUTeg_004706 [Tegillarca granosa]|uniref:Uncharacterized protein n=1 Tax=Tegillarca granosa TaxID=220873 RepID=A0ABQ9FJT1_TEGGR|nr:hypothetical protein KUTeg_004706 [Tegillarca granosa]
MINCHRGKCSYFFCATKLLSLICYSDVLFKCLKYGFQEKAKLYKNNIFHIEKLSHIFTFPLSFVYMFNTLITKVTPCEEGFYGHCYKYSLILIFTCTL